VIHLKQDVGAAFETLAQFIDDDILGNDTMCIALEFVYFNSITDQAVHTAILLGVSPTGYLE